jgi:hypothetical protein
MRALYSVLELSIENEAATISKQSGNLGGDSRSVVRVSLVAVKLK